MGRARNAFAPFFMRAHFAIIFLSVLALSPATLAQTPSAGAPAAAPGAANSAPASKHALELARTGHCAEALPLLKRANAATADKQIKREVGESGVKCAMTLGQSTSAVDFLNALTREFPHDPEVLYLATHVYSDLSMRASQELATTAPNSLPARQMDAEALQEQGKWDDARAVYEQILKDNPDARGIHYSIGQIILSKPATPTTGDDAKAEFAAELKIDPTNAGAEYVLGELARGNQQWDDAIAHFSQAVKLDASFSDAFRGLGMSYNASGKYDLAIAPLERYVKMQPQDPAGHYQLAIAYARTGHKEQAAHEMEIQRQLDAKARQQQNGADPNAPR
jgi:tetratricopeptide (TPR) repeat protein